MWQVIGPTGFVSGGTGAGTWAFSRIWYAAIALPIAQFVMYRWLWRWALWGYVLVVRISALPLDLLATHPDLLIGPRVPLSRPLSGFAGFGSRGRRGSLGGLGHSVARAAPPPLRLLLPSVLATLMGVLAIGVAPLLFFCGHLYRARRASLSQYGDFALHYMRDFHHKWLEGHAPATSLGSPDIQSLNDIGGAFGVITKTRLFVFGMRPVIAIWAATALPIAPAAGQPHHRRRAAQTDLDDGVGRRSHLTAGLSPMFARVARYSRA